MPMRKLGLWITLAYFSVVGQLNAALEIVITEGVDMEATKAMIRENIVKMNAGPQPQTIARRKWVEAQLSKRRR